MMNGGMMNGGMMSGAIACGGGMAIGWLLVLLLIAGVAYAAYRIGTSRAGNRPTNASSPVTDDAIELARRRYAQGEITQEEFETIRRHLG